jgi:crossover junction endodeoxyribonuclease RusA
MPPSPIYAVPPASSLAIPETVCPTRGSRRITSTRYDVQVDLPWDFVVPGVPVSVHSKNSRRRSQWKEAVAAEAITAWPAGQPPLIEKLQIHITYYHDSAPLDVDNQLKLIQDALCGIVYVDDNQLTDTHGHLRDINGSYRPRGITLAQGRGFSLDGPFVHVRIEPPGDREELP